MHDDDEPHWIKDQIGILDFLVKEIKEFVFSMQKWKSPLDLIEIQPHR